VLAWFYLCIFTLYFLLFLANKGLLNLKSKSCLVAVGQNVTVHLQLLPSLLLLSSHHPVTGPQACQSQNPRTSSQKHRGREEILPVTFLTSSTQSTICLVPTYHNAKLPHFNLP